MASAIPPNKAGTATAIGNGLDLAAAEVVAALLEAMTETVTTVSRSSISGRVGVGVWRRGSAGGEER